MNDAIHGVKREEVHILRDFITSCLDKKGINLEKSLRRSTQTHREKTITYQKPKKKKKKYLKSSKKSKCQTHLINQDSIVCTGFTDMYCPLMALGRGRRDSFMTWLLDEINSKVPLNCKICQIFIIHFQIILW